MRARTFPIVVLVAIIVAALGVSVAWAIGRGSGAGLGYGPMMGSQPTGQAQPMRTMAAAKQQAQRFADRLGLRAGEVMQFTRNYYVELTEPNGTGATEVLVDPSSGAVSLEYGPAMMWNTRYGVMRAGQGGMMGAYGRTYMGTTTGSGYGGMMGGTGVASGITVTVSPTQAVQVATRWLATNQPGSTPGPAEGFPGYYTLHTVHSGKITGMLSVNASTGAVIPHWWHGAFIAMAG